MNEIVSQVLAAIVSAAIGSLITISVFRSKLDSHTQALATFVNQRAEDRQQDLRENERLRQEFRDLCNGQANQRNQELEFIRRQVDDFRREMTASERRQRYVMDVVTAMARKQGIHHRITDPLDSDS
jgi:ATPase subunit of ABC transporter with duplicated ATPase domains